MNKKNKNKKPGKKIPRMDVNWISIVFMKRNNEIDDLKHTHICTKKSNWTDLHRWLFMPKTISIFQCIECMRDNQFKIIYFISSNERIVSLEPRCEHILKLHTEWQVLVFQLEMLRGQSTLESTHFIAYQWIFIQNEAFASNVNLKSPQIWDAKRFFQIWINSANWKVFD